VSAPRCRPSLGDLEAATARTAAVMADPQASAADRARAAELEEALYLDCPDWPDPVADAEMEAGIG
jgi:hypothetical protein